MIPPEVLRDMSVIAEIVNQGETVPGGIDRDWISGLIARYGMTYDKPPTERDCQELEQAGADFRIIFTLDTPGLADFANRTLDRIRFSPRVKNHGGYGWHIHHYDTDFPLARRIRSSTAMSVMSLIIHQEDSRLKVCRAPGCQRVFVDATRNGSKIYCDAKTCGNRANVANFRAKAAATSG